MENKLKSVLEVIQTLCIMAVSAAVIWFLWSIAPSFMIAFE